MKKYLFILILFSFFTLSLLSCSSSEDNEYENDNIVEDVALEKKFLGTSWKVTTQHPST